MIQYTVPLTLQSAKGKATTLSLPVSSGKVGTLDGMGWLVEKVKKLKIVWLYCFG